MKTDAPHDPKLVITSSPLDLELCELLGDKPSDFVILLADGKQVPGYGTPYDSETARKNCRYICDRLNDSGKDSWWPEFAANWGSKLAEIEIPVESQPVFSFEIHRVCAGNSQHDHCAIRLFGELGDRVSAWHVGMDAGRFGVELTMPNGKRYTEEGDTLALTVCNAVVRALREGGGGGGLVTPGLGAASGCGEGQVLREREREARRNVEVCDGGRKTTELKQDANRHSQH